MTDDTTRQRIEREIASNHVVLFMKGTKSSPQCGFSARVSSILQELGIDYKDIDVLADQALRDGIKSFSQWPTIPQLYVAGRFVGGCDIVSDLYSSGELQQLLDVDPVTAPNASITLSERAADELSRVALAEGEVLRLEIGADHEYDLFVEQGRSDDVEIMDKGVALRLRPSSAKRAGGLSIDYVERGVQAGFKIERQTSAPAERATSGR